jgi:lipid-binding SYLF domain-containing protein
LATKKHRSHKKEDAHMKAMDTKRTGIRRWAIAIVGVLALAPLSFARAEDFTKEQVRLRDAHAVMEEALHVPEGIPHDLLDRARCVIVIPSVLKAAFVVGASYGRGVMTCRTGDDARGPWGAPAMYALEGGSFGLQIGGQATDYILLVMNPHGVNSLLHSKVRLGGDLSVAAGPVGRDLSADTDAYMRSEILSYSRARGVFAGLSLEGSTLRPDNDANRELYGRRLTVEDIVRRSAVPAPASAESLLALLEESSPQLRS